jgi:hypothetical protein
MQVREELIIKLALLGYGTLNKGFGKVECPATSIDVASYASRCCKIFSLDEDAGHCIIKQIMLLESRENTAH